MARRTHYTYGWHTRGFLDFFVDESGCIVRGMINGSPVYPYRYSKHYDHYDRVNPPAYYGVLDTVKWF